MPSHVPRSDTTKKREQLLRREEELRHAIGSGFPNAKLIRAAENLRAAHLSLLKAKLYWAKDAAIRGDVNRGGVEKIEKDTQAWIAKPADDILREYNFQ